MPLLTNIEQRALARGQEKGAKETTQKYICQILEKRLGKIPDNLLNQIKQIEDINVLEELHLESISVQSLEEFEQLVNSNSTN